MNNIHKYRRAQVIVEELTVLLDHLKTSRDKLSHYFKYGHIRQIVTLIQDAEVELEIRLINEQKIIDNKGKIS